MAWRRGQAYSQDLRDRILAADGSARAVATQFLVSVSYVVKFRQRRDRKGEVTPGPQHSHAPRKLAALHEAIAAYAVECYSAGGFDADRRDKHLMSFL
jgi:transposase